MKRRSSAQIRFKQLELGLGVEAQVADELADVGPVLLLDVAAVVLVARP